MDNAIFIENRTYPTLQFPSAMEMELSSEPDEVLFIA